MADPIVQTIKIEVDGANEAVNEIKKVGQATEEAANEIKKVGEATEDVQKTAASSAGGTQALGKGLDEVSQKSSISGRELRSLSKIAKEFGADSVVVGLSLVRMAAVLGPVGAAVFALGAAFGAIKDRMKAADAAASTLASTFATLAEKSAATKLKDEAAFWGMNEAAMKKWNDEAGRVADQYKNIATGRAKAIGAEVSPEARQRGLIEILQKAGVEFDDVNAGAEKLNENGNKALMVFAQLAEKMSPIGRSQLFKDMKSFGFTDEQIKSVKMGSAALQKMQEDAAKFKASPEGIALDAFEESLKKSQEMVGSWGQSLKIKFAQAALGWKQVISGQINFGDVLAQAGRHILGGLAAIGSSIGPAVAGWVSTQVVGAWQWIVDTFNTAVGTIRSLASSVATSVAAFFMTAPGAAWQWIVDTFNAAVGAIGSLASSVATSVAAFFMTAPGAAWQWIVDTFNTAVGAIRSLASSVATSVVDFVMTAPGAAWQWIVDTFNAAVDAVLIKASEAKDFITSWVTTAVPGAWEWLKSTFFSVVDAILAKVRSSGLFGGGGGGAPAGAAIPGAAAGGLLGGRGTGTSDSNLAWVSRGEYIIPARIVRQPGMLALLEALRLRRFAGGGSVGTGGIPAYAEGGAVSNVVSVLDQVMQMIGGIGQAVGQMTIAIIDAMHDVMKNIDRAMKSFSDSSQTIISNAKEASDTLFDFKQAITGQARGGLLGGRGTGTSDSNLAWVSRGEHIMPASAVRQPGVLAFLEALRRSGGNLRDVLGGMGRFALGGMVPLAIPAFAGGGMNAVTINFPGLPEITGLRASSGVVDELRKAAAMAQVRSGGRKPSRYS